MLHIKTKVDISKGVLDTFKNIQLLGKGKGQRISRKVANLGYYKALSIAPHYSGALKGALTIKPTKFGGNLILNRPNQQSRGDKTPRNYHLWINGFGRYKQLAHNGHIKSGETMFIQKAGKYMEEMQLKKTLKWLKSKKL